MKEKLEQVRDWSKAKIHEGSEPPWSWYQHMKLIEAVEAILAGMSVATTDTSPQEERHLRLADESDESQSTGLPVHLPI